MRSYRRSFSSDRCAFRGMKGMVVKMNTKSIMIVGVGGQGTLLASRILGNLALLKGHSVKVSEVHGMAQRGVFTRKSCC